MTPFVPRVARLNSQSPAPLGERNGSSTAIWTIAAVAVLALSSLAAEMALRRNRNRRKCTTKRSLRSMRTIEPVFEAPVRPAVEQTAKTLGPSVPQTPEIAPALAAVPMAPEPTRLTDPSDEEIRLRAYFISEHRRRFALPGDTDSDWREAKQQLISESGELSGLSTITTEAPSEIPARTEDIALPAVVTSAETEVGSIERGEPMPYETTFTAIQSPAAEAVTESASDCPNAISPEPAFPHTTAPAIMPELTQMPTAPVNTAKPSGTMQTCVKVTFSFEIAAAQLTPTFKMGVLEVRPISKIVTMRLAPSQRPQPEVSFEIAKIQPVGKTFGTILVTPSQKERPIMRSPSVAGLQLVPNVEATPVQLMPLQQGQAAVFVTVPCQISRIEFSPLLEIASIVLDSSSKHVLVQLPGAGPSPADGPRAFEIADLQLNERGDAGMMQLNLLDQSPMET